MGVRRWDGRALLSRAALAASIGMLLAAEGVAVVRSPLLAAPVVGLLMLIAAPQLPLLPCLAGLLAVRVLTDSTLASATNRHSGSVNMSGAIALVFVLLAVGLMLTRRRALLPACLALGFIALWTFVATATHGASTVTVREGVREASIVTVALIVLNSAGAITVPRAVRIVQLAGAGAALLAIYQLATHTGVDISGEIRANGTFSHPNGAAMYFAIATTASLWRYLDWGRARADLLLTTLFAASAVATFSIGGVASLLVMLMAYGSFRQGGVRLKLRAYAAATVILIGFVASPIGAERLAQESETKIGSSVNRRTAETSAGWRLYKWQSLIPEWERGPFLGQGLGTTVTVEGTSSNATTSKVPHNEYVRYLVETGIVGLALVLVAIGASLRGLLRRRRIPGSANQAAFGLAVLLGCLFNAVGDNTFLYGTTGYAAALILGAVLALPRRAAARPRAKAGRVRT